MTNFREHMEELWEVYHWDDPWEPEYSDFLTSDKNYAEWYVGEVNKCNDNWETYGVRKFSPPPILENHDHLLTFGFAWDLDVIFVSSELHTYPEEDFGINDELGLILCNGNGDSYGACFRDALRRAERLKKDDIHVIND